MFATLTHDESIDTPLSITNNNGTFYYHRDHQGSIVALTDENGNVVESFSYDNHYGAIINRTKTVETNNPYGYTGREVDAGDLYYYRARYYDPTIQRFISEDPIGFSSGDFNWYRYVNDDPVNLVDPWGLCSIAKWLKSPIQCLRSDVTNVDYDRLKKIYCTKGYAAALYYCSTLLGYKNAECRAAVASYESGLVDPKCENDNNESLSCKE